MQVKVNNKIYNIPEETLEQYQKKLDISQEEAIEMWLSDRDIIVNEEVEELTQKAKQNGTSKIIVQSSVEKKKTERKPKENPLKTAILQDILNFLAKNSTIYDLKLINPTKQIDFKAENKEFSINLVEHRPKKDKKS